MLHHYEHKDELTVVLQLPTRDGKQRNIAFRRGEVVIDDTEDKFIAQDIEATQSFKMGAIRKVSGDIKKASRKFVTVSGARGADPTTAKKE
jgi:hypothetical protein